MFDKKYLIIGILLFTFFYTRFVGIDWGLPFPMHPDERNIAAAIQDLDCPSGSSMKECFNPHFFAYGQFPIYSAYAMVRTWHFIRGFGNQSIGFVEATLALRFISILSSLLNLYFIIRIVALFQNPKTLSLRTIILCILLFTFVPYAIQFSHFGTTESLLMALYTGIIYYSLRILNSGDDTTALYMSSLLAGAAIGTKVSSLFFLGVPIIAIVQSKNSSVFSKILAFGTFLFFTICAAAFFSPHNLISYDDFRGAMNYEIGIGQGTVVAFYNRQFDNTLPLLFHFARIFPYVFGSLQFVIAFLAMLFLPYTRKFNLLRIAFFLYFIPTSILYAKWTRFIAPIFPILTIFVIFAVDRTLSKFKSNFISVFFLLLLLPGLAYLSIYKNNDVRFKASEWIKKNISTSTHILSETANVVDIPIQSGYNVASFDLYHVDTDPSLQEKLSFFTQDADYIFIPSRRIFANNTCYRFIDGDIFQKKDGISIILDGYKTDTCSQLTKKYPLINSYYDRLFSQQLPYRKVAEITSYPHISLFGKKIYEIRDENAEETWTVFDHPVIRIYKRI
jgi:hypothetical protein